MIQVSREEQIGRNTLNNSFSSCSEQRLMALILFIYTHVYVCVHMYYVCTIALRSWKKELDSLKLELTGSCELPHVGAGNQSWVLYKNSTHA